MVLLEGRVEYGDFVLVDNEDAYDAYKMLFPTVKDAGGNSMQISEIQFYNVPEPISLSLLGLGGLALLRRRR